MAEGLSSEVLQILNYMDRAIQLGYGMGQGSYNTGNKVCAIGAIGVVEGLDKYWYKYIDKASKVLNKSINYCEGIIIGFDDMLPRPNSISKDYMDGIEIGKRVREVLVEEGKMIERKKFI